MAKVLMILLALVVLGAAAPQFQQSQQQSRGTFLQERRTTMEWEQLANMIDEVFGISSDREERGEPEQEQMQEQEQELEQELEPEQDQELEQEQDEEQATEQSETERRADRMREFMERQRERSGAAALEDRAERNREAMERAEGRLPEREARRRQQHQQKHNLLKKLVEKKRKQWEQDQEQERSGQKMKKDRDYNSFPLYEFAYGVHDPTTGDKKEQWEKRVGDHVKGKYTLDQPDGTKRIVEYEADDKKGFEAVVKEIDRIDERNRGDVRWGHSDGQVAQSYSTLKKVD